MPEARHRRRLFRHRRRRLVGAGVVFVPRVSVGEESCRNESNGLKVLHSLQVSRRRSSESDDFYYEIIYIINMMKRSPNK